MNRIDKIAYLLLQSLDDAAMKAALEEAKRAEEQRETVRPRRRRKASGER